MPGKYVKTNLSSKKHTPYELNLWIYIQKDFILNSLESNQSYFHFSFFALRISWNIWIRLNLLERVAGETKIFEETENVLEIFYKQQKTVKKKQKQLNTNSAQNKYEKYERHLILIIPVLSSTIVSCSTKEKKNSLWMVYGFRMIHIFYCRRGYSDNI